MSSAGEGFGFERNFTQILNQFQQRENDQSFQKYECPRLTFNLRSQVERSSTSLRAPLIGNQPRSSLCRRRETSVLLSHLFLSPGKIRPSVTHVCSDCGVMGNDTPRRRFRARSLLSQALNSSLGARRFGSLPQPFKEAVDDMTARSILQPGCWFSSYVWGFSILST